jgi:hypothetical protein
MAIKITVERDGFIKNLREIDMVARSYKNTPTSELAAVVYKSGRLFMRAESPVTILQLVMDVESGPDEGLFRVAVNTKKLLACARQCKTGELTVEVQKTGLKFGKGIRVASEDPTMFGRLPDGVSKAERICDIMNPIPAVERAAHCLAKENEVPLTGRCLTIMPTQIMAAWVDQSIVVDCQFLPRGYAAFVPGKELLRMRHLGEGLNVRQSKDWFVLRSDSNILAVRQQKMPEFVNKVRKMFESISFVDQISLTRDELLAPLKTAETVLGKHAILTCTVKGSKANWHGEEEGNQYEFTSAAEVPSGNDYFFGVEIQKFKVAVGNCPFEHIIVKIEELGAEGSVRLHLVDEESHEIISLDTIHAVRQITEEL